MTVTFLTVAFAQLWHVFNMRHPTSGLLRNEITRNPWIWAALALCAGLLVTAAYVPSLSANASSGGAGYQNVGNCSRHEPGSANPWPNRNVLCELVFGQETSTHKGLCGVTEFRLPALLSWRSRNLYLRLFCSVWLGFHDCLGKALIQISPTRDGPPVVEKDFERAPICDPA